LQPVCGEDEGGNTTGMCEALPGRVYDVWSSEGIG
jgi:hypothetical protein